MEPVSVRRHTSRKDRRSSQGQNIDRSSRRTSSEGQTPDGGSHGTSGAGSDSPVTGNDATDGANISAPPGGSTENQTANTSWANQNPSVSWNQCQVPGGRKLWRRLVIAFAVVASFGAIFITLGAVYLDEAKEWGKKDNLTLPLVLCIISIIVGLLFIFGSIILGKLIISDKWRKNQQPTYRNMALRATVSYSRPRTETSGQHLDGNIDIQMEPPSYEASAGDPTSPPHNVFIISGRDINVNMPGSEYRQPPPDYTEHVDMPPPEYTETATDIQSPDGSTFQECDPPPAFTASPDGSSEGPGVPPSYTPGVSTVSNAVIPVHPPGVLSHASPITPVLQPGKPTLNPADIHRVLGGRPTMGTDRSSSPSEDGATDPMSAPTGDPPSSPAAVIIVQSSAGAESQLTVSSGDTPSSLADDL